MIQNQLFLSTRCVISRYQMLMKMSTVAPTFSSSGDNSKIVTRLGPNRVSTMIMTGKPNRPAPPAFKLDLEEFTSGAVSAVSLVTHDMVSDQWDSLPDLLEPHCLSSMKRIIASLSEEE